MNSASFKNKKIAIIAGSGDLPIEVIKSAKEAGIDFSVIRFSGISANIPSNENVIDATFEQISELFSELEFSSFNAVAFCGYILRPKLNFNRINSESREILEPIIKNFVLGDEAIFTSILELFKSRGLTPISISQIVPNFFPTKEFLTVLKPTSSDIIDSELSEKILRVTSVVDLGQSLVVSQGVCLALETAPGTDAMLESLRTIKEKDSSIVKGGVFYKAPKEGQNLFIDQPVIGLRTIIGVKEAGLNGIVIKQSKVIVLRQEQTINLANELGIFVWSKK